MVEVYSFETVGTYRQRSKTILFIVTVQAIRRWILAAESQVQSRVTSHDIRGGQTENGEGSTRSSFHLPPLITIPTLLHTRLQPPLVVYNRPDQAAPGWSQTMERTFPSFKLPSSANMGQMIQAVTTWVGNP
jgi:hypothetical protein